MIVWCVWCVCVCASSYVDGTCVARLGFRDLVAWGDEGNVIGTWVRMVRTRDCLKLVEMAVKQK